MTMRTPDLVFLVLLLLSLADLAWARPAITRSVNQSTAESVLAGKQMQNREMEIIMRTGVLKTGKFVRFSDGAIHLRDGDSIQLCFVQNFRISRKTGGSFRRIAGALVGFIAGSVIGVPAAFAISADAPEAALAVYSASLAGGVWFGSRLFLERQDTVYLIPIQGSGCESRDSTPQ